MLNFSSNPFPLLPDTQSGYTPQLLLQVGAALWLNSSQWHVNRSDVGHSLAWHIKSFCTWSPMLCSQPASWLVTPRWSWEAIVASGRAVSTWCPWMNKWSGAPPLPQSSADLNLLHTKIHLPSRQLHHRCIKDKTHVYSWSCRNMEFVGYSS